MTNDTVIRDIKIAMEEQFQLSRQPKPDRSDWKACHERLRGERRHGFNVQSMTLKAIEAFGAINGWHTGPDVRAFGVQDIGKRCSSAGALFSTAMFDHCVWYRANGKCAAIVAQPYQHAQDDYARALAAEHGVAVHIPPQPLASFHYPGWAKIFVFTSPAHQIVWLEEQRT